MKDEIIVKRYAEAFLSFSKDNQGREKALLDLRNLKNIILRDNPEFLEFLLSPEITYQEKAQVIDAVLGIEFSQEVKYFLKFLIEKNRIDKIADICEYVRINYAHAGETEAILRTTFPLDLKLIKLIEEKLEQKFKRKIKFYIDLDASLLGGLQVIMGNTIIDGSVKKRLEQLREKISNVRIS